MKSEKNILLVLGMHRSGTSAVTGSLRYFGFDLGGDLLPPGDDNPTGFWENSEVVSHHDHLLSSLDSAWDDPFEFSPGWQAPEHVTALAEIVRGQFDGLDRPCVKDPRASRFLPLWLAAIRQLNWTARCLVVIRAPWDVVTSLQTRNGLDAQAGYVLWLRYMLSLLRYLPQEGVAFIGFEDFLQKPARSIEKSVNTLFPGEEMSVDAELLNAFVDPALRHHDQAQVFEGVSPEISSLVTRVFQDLQELASGNVEFSPDKYQAYLDEFNALETLSTGWIRRKAVLAERKTLTQKLASLDSQLKEEQKRSEGYRDQLNEILDSRSWKLTGFLRAIKGKTVGSGSVKQWLYFLLKRAYHRVPIDIRHKNRVRSFLQRAFPFLNRLSSFQANNRSIKKEIGIVETRIKDVALEDIDFEIKSRNLDVSIIVPVFNNCEYTTNCLKSIFVTGADLSFEVIVVDDGSSDSTAETMSAIKGLKYLKNEKNLGFLRTCNRGAEESSGRYLVFLNNDTLVFPGWLDALVRPFSTGSRVGMTGAKLVYPDGRLQEAGGIIWSDGSGWNYGRLADPSAPEFSYLREVDYCSGACICIDRVLFEGIGRFDDRFAPAYYEDTDLAFSVRAKGFKVFYQPESIVIHYEGVSCGTDLSSGIKKFQAINAQKFVEKWRDVLNGHAPNGQYPDREKDRYVKGRVLVIDAVTPTPDRDSGSLRMQSLMQALCGLGYKVTFVPDNLQYLDQYTPALQQLGIEVLYRPFIPNIDDALKCQGDFFDVVILSRPYVADLWIDKVRKFCPRARIVFDTVDLHFLREQRQAEIEGNAAMARRAADTKKLEFSLMRKADVTYVVSPYEKQLLDAELPEVDIQVLSNIHSIHGSATPFSLRKDLLFIGGFNHPPNADAVHFFVEEVWGKVSAALPSTRFYIIGSDVPDDIRALANERIIVTGFVDDIAPYFNKCLLSVAPLRYGAGVKGKINSSMSYGVPVVSTAIGVEGMTLTHGVDALVTDQPDEFADYVISLCRDEDLWNRLSRNGLKNLEDHFSFEAAIRTLEKLHD